MEIGFESGDRNNKREGLPIVDIISVIVAFGVGLVTGAVIMTVISLAMLKRGLLGSKVNKNQHV